MPGDRIIPRPAGMVKDTGDDSGTRDDGESVAEEVAATDADPK